MPVVDLKQIRRHLYAEGRQFGDVGAYEQVDALLTQLTTNRDEGRLAFQEKRKPNFTGGLRRKGEAFEELTAEQRERIDYLKRTGGAG